MLRAASLPGIGELASRRLVNDLGDKMTLQNAAFSLAFKFESHVGELAPSDGTDWKDPDIPLTWQGRSGVVGQNAWSG